MGHARALIGQDDAAALARRAVNDNLSVRDVEKLARQASGGGTATAKPVPVQSENADILAVQNHLEDMLGLKVQIKTDTDPSTGAITIQYKTLDQLDLVCQRLTGGEF